VTTTDARDTTLRLLDGFELRHRGAPLLLTRGSQRILAFLALANREIERGAVAYQLWPDNTDDRAVANLRCALWRIRQQPASLVTTSSTRVRLHPDVWVDARDGIRELGVLAPEAILEENTSVTMCGELLPDWYDEWLLTERERLRQLRLHALEDAARRCIEEGCFSRAIDAGLRAIAMEPLRESAHELVISAHLAEGNTWEAFRQYERLETLLRDELGVEPSPRLRHAISAPGPAAERVSS
jgi:DNA-binding SARP family transcriptional activator